MASDFIKEKIKDRPIDKKKLLKRIGMTVLIAVIFGVVSAVTFSLVYAHIRPDESESIKPVSLSGEEAEQPAEDGLSDDETENGEETDTINVVSLDETASENEAVSENGTVSENETTPSENETNEPSPARPSTIINNITNNVDVTPENYAKLYKSIHDVAILAGKSLVTVTATTTDTDWFENPYETGSSAIGMIVADNGRQMLILIDSSVTENAEDISVVFADGTNAGAKILNTDSDTSLQIIGVELSDISDETKNKISYASFGSSTYASTVGTPVIAIGSPIGITGSEEYGFITSMSQEKEMSDFNVHLLTTDIHGSDNASGVIVDYSGHVLGVITTSYKDNNLAGLITTYSISDIKETIENLANGKERTYMGIVGTSVTQEAADTHNMPMGAYVINVDPDSPAMSAGIQSGDVITKIGTQTIVDYSDYSKAIAELSAGVETVVTVQRFSRGDYTELTFETELSKK